MAKFKYPTLSDVSEAGPIVAAALRGKVDDVKETALAVYVVQGFGMSVFPGSPDEDTTKFKGKAKAKKPGAYTLQSAAKDCDKLAAADFDDDNKPEMFGAGKINWAALLPILAQLLAGLLSQQQQ